jgi:hypothetical protein
MKRSLVIWRRELTKTRAQCQAAFPPILPTPRQSEWHVNCEHSEENKIMAARVKMLTLLQEIRGFAQVSNRRPPPRSSGLFLAQLRLRGNRASLRRGRLNISIEPPTQPDIPLQIKIHHVRQSPDSSALASAP